MTTAHTATGIRASLEYIQGVFGPNFFPVTENRAKVWSDQLRDLDDAQLIEGARKACAGAQRGQPPIPADIIAAVLGRWVVESHPGCDNFGAISPDNPKRPFHLLKDFSGSVTRAFNMNLDLLEWPSQKKLVYRAQVLAEMRHLLPPSERERLERPADYLAPKVDFKASAAGLLGQ